MSRLINANSKRLSDLSANLPDVSAAVMSMLFPMVFEKVQTTRVNGYAQNIPEKIRTSACIQPFTARMLKLKPEGDRAWSWFSIYALPNLILKDADKVIVDKHRYKIMEKMDWSRYGYVMYNAIEDYQYVANESNNQ